MTDRQFPDGFLWGAATAAHQIEGSNVNSDFWFLENVQPSVFVERSGDTCDSYHRYADDIAMLAAAGLNTYRFSIEWARIEPTQGHVSQAELDHYRRVIECCHAHGVKAAPTMFHATAPIWFARLGGWLNPDSPALFADYCATVAGALADGMECAFTINEPQVSKVFRAIPGAAESYFAKHDTTSVAMHAEAARLTGSDRFVSMEYPDIDAMTPQLVAAHEQAYAAIKAARSDLPVGVTLSVTDFQPGSDDSPYESVRATAYGTWIECIRRAGDFTGVQNYRQIRLPGSGEPYPPLPTMPFTQPDDRLAAIQRPEALANTVEYIHRATGKPAMVTENGLQTDDDERRVWYIREALRGLHDVIERGVPVLGYLHWTLIDNYEWTQGYAPKYGLTAIDRTTFARIPKPSLNVLGSIARRNAL